MSKKVLITSALPYVNNVPHLGNIVGCVLPADVYSRYCKLNGKDVLYICGTDEYGTCTEVKAREEGLTPRQICDKYYKVHKEIYDWFQIEFDYFGRTSTGLPHEDLDWPHTVISQEIFKKVVDNGYVIEQQVEQLYCVELDSFMADRFVVGTCPKVDCEYEKAKGDQCDKCGALLNAVEIINPVYKLNPDYKLIKKTTTHLYLDLPKLEPRLKEWFESVNSSWAKNAVSITQSWFDEGLRPRCITRDLKWGTPVPDTETFGNKYKDKVMYNWFDAPIGYLSITANYTKEWSNWWKNPEEVELVQTYSKDNIPFHTIIFPATLMATNDNYTLVTKIGSCEYLTYEGGKFSKSENTGVFGDNAVASGISSDVWRYYLMRQRPENKDTDFSWDDLQAKYNGELANNLGNLMYRVHTFTSKKLGGTVPERKSELLDVDNEFIDHVNNLCDNYMNYMDKIELKNGLKTVLSISHASNKYIVDTEHWVHFKTDMDRCHTILHILNHTAVLIARLLEPFMPETSRIINSFIVSDKLYRYEHNKLVINMLTGKSTNKPQILFKKISDEEISELKQKY